MNTKTTLTALAMLIGLTASAQTPAAPGATPDFDTLMSMHALGERAVMQSFNGGACQVSPLSSLPLAVRSVLGRPVSSIYVGDSAGASHFLASDIDKTYFANGTVVVSLCAHLKPGAELNAMRLSAARHGVPNAGHMAWMWEAVSFDQNSRQETVLARYYLDEHGMLLKALGELYPGLPPLMTMPENDPQFDRDVASFLENHRPPMQSAKVQVASPAGLQ